MQVITRFLGCCRQDDALDDSHPIRGNDKPSPGSSSSLLGQEVVWGAERDSYGTVPIKRSDSTGTVVQRPKKVQKPKKPKQKRRRKLKRSRRRKGNESVKQTHPSLSSSVAATCERSSKDDLRRKIAVLVYTPGKEGEVTHRNSKTRTTLKGKRTGVSGAHFSHLHPSVGVYGTGNPLQVPAFIQPQTKITENTSIRTTPGSQGKNNIREVLANLKHVVKSGT